MQALFIDSRSGPLFAVYWPPVDSAKKGAILHVAAFAEEMNKSRRMIAMQSRILAKQGYAVLVIDLFGTGDSAGDFREATWSIWLENIADGIAWLKKQGAINISLWGLRLGALLSMDFAGRNAGLIDQLIAWQPVVNGDTFVTQFLRLRIAAAMMNSPPLQEKTTDLKRQLIGGEYLEIAGYYLNPDLIRPLLTLRAIELDLRGIKDIAIIELLANEDTLPSAATQKFFEQLLAQGVSASFSKLVGENFWASQEITTSPNLIELTSRKVERWS